MCGGADRLPGGEGQCAVAKIVVEGVGARKLGGVAWAVGGGGGEIDAAKGGGLGKDKLTAGVGSG